jgi:hypothetical protein
VNISGSWRFTAAYAQDATVWTAGPLPFSDTHTMGKLPEFMGGILSQFPGGLRFTVTGITTRGNRVAVEVESEGRQQSGESQREEIEHDTPSHPMEHRKRR